MSTVLRSFRDQEDTESPATPALLAAALEAYPDAIAIAADNRLIYRNRRFRQVYGRTEHLPQKNLDYIWQETEFSADGRKLLLLTRRPAPPIADSQRLALVGRLVGGVAHDFNNLLTGILLYCDLMQSKISRSNALARKIEEIRTAAEQGAGLIRQLMNVGREEKDAPHSVSLNDALRDISPLLRHLVGENVHITLDLCEGPGVVGVSLAQAQQIVFNLVLNARDAMPNGGQVSMATTSLNFEGTGPTDHILELTVKDCGTGMEPQTAARIFDPFFTTKAPGHGTGLGLTTVRKIVDDAGGIISLETAIGKGTQITVHLPQVQAEFRPDTARENPTHGLARSQNNRGAA